MNASLTETFLRTNCDSETTQRTSPMPSLAIYFHSFCAKSLLVVVWFTRAENATEWKRVRSARMKLAPSTARLRQQQMSNGTFHAIQKRNKWKFIAKKIVLNIAGSSVTVNPHFWVARQLSSSFVWWKISFSSFTIHLRRGISIILPLWTLPCARIALAFWPLATIACQSDFLLLRCRRRNRRQEALVQEIKSTEAEFIFCSGYSENDLPMVCKNRLPGPAFGVFKMRNFVPSVACLVATNWFSLLRSLNSFIHFRITGSTLKRNNINSFIICFGGGGTHSGYSLHTDSSAIRRRRE